MNRILIVDDEANIRRMLGALLRAEGFDVSEAASGNAALLAIEEAPPDAMLLDLMMPPGSDGLATLEKIRERDASTPVIMMSGKAQLADAVRAIQLGAFQFLEKPLGPGGGAGDAPVGPGADRGPRPRTARSAPRSGNPGRAGRHGPGDRAGPRADRAGGADRGPGADLRRVGHRQGTGGQRHPSRQPPGDPAVGRR